MQPVGLQLLEQLSQASKSSALFQKIVTRPRHGHQSAQFQPRQGRDRPGQFPGLVDGYSALGRFSADVDLQAYG